MVVVAAALARPEIREYLESSCYDVVAEHLRALASRLDLGAAAAPFSRCFELIARESLGLRPADMHTSSDGGYSDGAPIQFAVVQARQQRLLQFLCEVGEPGSAPAQVSLLAERKLRTLMQELTLNGDADELAGLLQRNTAMSSREFGEPQGPVCWMGAGVTPQGDCGLKVYLNGRGGSEGLQWARMREFAAFFGAAEIEEELWSKLARRMVPLGMAILLGQQKPSGRLYFHGYGNLVSFYEELLRHFGGEAQVASFRQYAPLMLGGESAQPTQSVVFSVGLDGEHRDLRIEFCAHCVFASDWQARERCLHWLALRKLDNAPYTGLLAALAAPISMAHTDTHMYVGLGWKAQQEYSTVYLKPSLHSRKHER